jgi:hypothetical protein
MSERAGVDTPFFVYVVRMIGLLTIRHLGIGWGKMGCRMPSAKIQSIEPQVTEIVNGWLKSYGCKYYLQQESMNVEIDAALEKAESKSGGKGGNRPDVKMILQDSKLDYYPVMIEYKGYRNTLEKLDGYGHIDNTKVNGTPNYNNIKNYAVNGAIHYADAILQYTSYTDVIYSDTCHIQHKERIRFF